MSKATLNNTLSPEVKGNWSIDKVTARGDRKAGYRCTVVVSCFKFNLTLTLIIQGIKLKALIENYAILKNIEENDLKDIVVAEFDAGAFGGDDKKAAILNYPDY